MSFSQAVSGLNAASNNLDVIGNNIASSATVGFKASNISFADMYAGSNVGLGTRVASVLQDFSNGSITSTSVHWTWPSTGMGFIVCSIVTVAYLTAVTVSSRWIVTVTSLTRRDCS